MNDILREFNDAESGKLAEKNADDDDMADINWAN